jgi:hypothetical protein
VRLIPGGIQVKRIPPHATAFDLVLVHPARAQFDELDAKGGVIGSIIAHARRGQPACDAPVPLSNDAVAVRITNLGDTEEEIGVRWFYSYPTPEFAA